MKNILWMFIYILIVINYLEENIFKYYFVKVFFFYKRKYNILYFSLWIEVFIIFNMIFKGYKWGKINENLKW